MGILTAVGIAPAANSAGSRTSISVPAGGWAFVRDFTCRRLVGGGGEGRRGGARGGGGGKITAS